jgi:hypothetical protein
MVSMEILRGPGKKSIARFQGKAPQSQMSLKPLAMFIGVVKQLQLSFEDFFGLRRFRVLR